LKNIIQETPNELRRLKNNKILPRRASYSVTKLT